MSEFTDADLARAMRALLEPNDALVRVAYEHTPDPIDIDMESREAFARLVQGIARAALTLEPR